MIAIYPAEQRYHASHGWLESYFSYSFADYYDPDNMQFGPMRVLNDDYIAASEGFGMHPHREMEIVTLVLSGRLEHQDSMGNRANTTWGGIQRMSAGTGVFHSEMNPSEEEAVQLLQMWFMPSEQGIEPSYETSSFDPQSLHGQLVPIVSGSSDLQQAGTVAVIHQDMTMYLTELADGQSVQFKQGERRRVFLFVLEGSVKVEGGSESASLGRRDSARIEGQANLTITGQSGDSGRVLLIDLP
ncbi:pirin family protein [Paenibacillus sp. PR3]|uniref:Pirin family protein n=1 Tax=Paenibacillus terricola TaxID=2763503 RepID=A0ABR8MNB7_9BACL|nr:pirin family protein [Paenibacillus terricola]MBD3917507.1 pirin family protein [Paenibacillus terricola]